MPRWFAMAFSHTRNDSSVGTQRPVPSYQNASKADSDAKASGSGPVSWLLLSVAGEKVTGMAAEKVTHRSFP